MAILPWPWRSFAKWDNKISYRLDERMVRTPSGPTPKIGEWFLRLVSLLLTLVLLVLVTAGIWLIAAHFFNFAATLGGLALIGIAFLLRPRISRPLHDSYLLREPDQPEFFALLRRVADTAGSAMPHKVYITAGWNASAAVAGLRRERILRIGLPLWLSLTGQERAARA